MPTRGTTPVAGAGPPHNVGLCHVPVHAAPLAWRCQKGDGVTGSSCRLLGTSQGLGIVLVLYLHNLILTTNLQGQYYYWQLRKRTFRAVELVQPTSV